MTDADILSLLEQRQEAGIGHLKEQYEHYCMAVARRILDSSEDCEEVINDVWLRVWIQTGRECPRNLPGYLARITRNLALDRYRMLHTQRRGSGETALALEELSEILGGRDDTADALQVRELSAALDRFLDRIPQRDRSIFLRRYFYLQSDRDIAACYGLTPMGVRTVMSRTRKKLKTYLKKEGYL